MIETNIVQTPAPLGFSSGPGQTGAADPGETVSSRGGGQFDEVLQGAQCITSGEQGQEVVPGNHPPAPSATQSAASGSQSEGKNGPAKGKGSRPPAPSPASSSPSSSSAVAASVMAGSAGAALLVPTAGAAQPTKETPSTTSSTTSNASKASRKVPPPTPAQAAAETPGSSPTAPSSPLAAPPSAAVLPAPSQSLSVPVQTASAGGGPPTAQGATQEPERSLLEEVPSGEGNSLAASPNTTPAPGSVPTSKSPNSGATGSGQQGGGASPSAARSSSTGDLSGSTLVRGQEGGSPPSGNANQQGPLISPPVVESPVAPQGGGAHPGSAVQIGTLKQGDPSGSPATSGNPRASTEVEKGTSGEGITSAVASSSPSSSSSTAAPLGGGRLAAASSNGSPGASGSVFDGSLGTADAIRSIRPAQVPVQGKEGVTISMEPEGLGPIRATVLSGGGEISVTLQATTPHGYETLVSTAPQLHQELGSLAPRVHVDVRRGSQNHQGGFGEQARRESKGRAPSSPAEGELKNSTSSPAHRLEQGRLVDIRL